VLGIAALAGAGFAGWTLYRVATAPAPAAPEAPEGPGIANTQTVEAVLATVKQLINDGQPSAAETVLSKAVRQFPADQDLRLSYGDLLMTGKRWSEAYDQYVGAIELGPVPAPVEFSAGTLASMTDRPTLAAAHFAAAMRLDPGEPNYPMYLASTQLKLNQTNEAKASLAIAARLAPERAQIWGMLTQIALTENKLGIAAQHIEKARRIQPAEPVWVLMDARVRKRQGEIEQALDLLHTLPQQEMDQPATLSLLAECYGMVGRPAEAASRYIDAAERKPDDADLAFESAMWLQRAGEPGEAVRWARRAAGLGHPRAEAWISAQPSAPTDGPSGEGP
jgi:predicted Zn-dependent protease